MKKGKFKDPLCYLFLPYAVVSPQSLTQKVESSNTVILLIF